MNLEIKNITIAQLEDFIHSDEFEQLDFLPISYIRAVSHIHNPRADKEDKILFLAYDGDKFVGYLGAVPDMAHFTNGKQKIYFLSCMYVSREYRRHRVAYHLMKHAYDELESNILITNYIPQAKAVYDAAGNYTQLVMNTGIRAYLRPDFATILLRHKRNLKKFAGIIKAGNYLLGGFTGIKLKLYKNIKTNTGIEFIPIEHFDKILKETIDKLQKGNLFQRNITELNWISDFPWVIESPLIPEESSKYFFSDYKKDFKCSKFLIKKDNKPAGIIILTQNDYELKTPYLLFPEELTGDVTNYLVQYMIKSNTRTFVCHHKGICDLLRKKSPFFHIRTSEKGFLITEKLHKLLPANFSVNEGDGDAVFT